MESQSLSLRDNDLFFMNCSTLFMSCLVADSRLYIILTGISAHDGSCMKGYDEVIIRSAVLISDLTSSNYDPSFDSDLSD